MLEFLHSDIKRDSHTVLKDVTFSLPPNSLTALIGRNGCGKSTLLSTLIGESRYTGSVRLESRELSSIPVRERARMVATLPQALPAPHMTVAELVELGRLPHLSLTSPHKEEDKEAILQALFDVDMQEFRSRYLDEISGGERQKAFLAMILSQKTPLLALDEPTTYMDIAGAHRFMELLDTLKKERKKTVLVAMHDLNLAVRYADHIAILDGGRLKMLAPVKECLKEQIIERTFGVRRVDAEGHILFVG